MQLNPLLDLPEPDLLVLDCIKRGDLDGLKRLHKDGFQWLSLVICPYHFTWPYGFPEKKNIFDGFFKEVGLYEWDDEYTKLIREVIRDLCRALDEPGNLDYVQAYLKAGYDLHRYDGSYIRYAVDSRCYEIAELLIQDGSPLEKWPYLLYEQIFMEVSHFDNERYEMGNEDFYLDGERIRFMLEHGSSINCIKPYYSSNEEMSTPLDFAIKLNHGPAIEVLKEYGGKRASELEGGAE